MVIRLGFFFNLKILVIFVPNCDITSLGHFNLYSVRLMFFYNILYYKGQGSGIDYISASNEIHLSRIDD